MPISSPLTNFQIEWLKITLYLLNVESRDGKSKAVYFIAHGFSPNNPDQLARALFEHATGKPLEKMVESRYGTKFVYRGELACPKGPSSHEVRTVWEVANGETIARFITAYPCSSKD